MSNLDFGWNIVGFFDLLGQKRKLRELATSSESRWDQDEIVRGLRQTYGHVIAFRDTIHSLFSGRIRTSFSSIHDIELPVGERKAFHALTRRDFAVDTFSDSIIVRMPLEIYDGHPNLTPLHYLIQCAGIMQYWFMSKNVPVRGAIEIGLGLVPEDNGEIYGPVLSDVHELESRYACFPRIIIGTRAIEYFESRKKICEQKTDAMSRMESGCLGLIQRTLRVWSDGWYTADLNVIRRSIELEIGEPFGSGFCETALETARSLRDTYKAKSDPLYPRYENLVALMEGRDPSCDFRSVRANP